MSDPREPVDGAQPSPTDADLDPDFLDDPPEPTVDDAEAGAEVDETDLENEGEPEPPRQTRRERQTENWRARAERAEREAAELRGRQSVLEARPQAPVDPAARAREEAAELDRVQQMLPHEVARYYAEKSARETQQQIFQARVEGFDRSDRAEFSQLRQTNRSAERHAAKVEEILQGRRQNGDWTLGRKQILAFLIGEETLNKGPTAAAGQRRQAAARVAGQTTRPASGRGDVGRGNTGRNQGDADERLLRGTTLGDIV